MVISVSNATPLSAELATLIAGRYVTLQVFPITLAEFGDLYRQRPGATPEDAELCRRSLKLRGAPATPAFLRARDRTVADLRNRPCSGRLT